MIAVTFTDDEREKVLTTLAFVALDRPYLADALRSLAAKFGDQGATMFDALKWGLSPDRPAEPTKDARKGRQRAAR